MNGPPDVYCEQRADSTLIAAGAHTDAKRRFGLLRLVGDPRMVMR